MLVSSALLWDITQRRVVIQVFLDLLTLEDGQIRCPETSVKDYHSTFVTSQESTDLKEFGVKCAGHIGFKITILQLSRSAVAFVNGKRVADRVRNLSAALNMK
jgi:formate-dependent phosphoribosylglycinamide formyltransferase (GAR transformylase)